MNRRFPGPAFDTLSDAKLHPFSQTAKAGQAHLRVLATTDLHAHVWPYDYYADREHKRTGLAQLATDIARERQAARNSILVDNGDFLQGSPLGDFIAYERGLKEGDLHPVIAAMNAFGYDAGTLGNHEFNYGISFLNKAMAGAEFPFTSANVVTKLGGDESRDQTFVAPYILLDRQILDGAGLPANIRIGVIGFTPPQIVTWDREHLDGNIWTRDIVRKARALVPEMLERGADVIVALSHSGIGSAEHKVGMEDATIPLAEITGIDALVSGHAHLVYPPPANRIEDISLKNRGMIHGKPVTMPGFWGSHLGLVDLLLQQEGSGWQILDQRSDCIPASTCTENVKPTSEPLPDAKTLAMSKSTHVATLAYVRNRVGRSKRPLHNYFARIRASAATKLLADAQMWFMKDYLKDHPVSKLPMVSAAAPFKAGGRGGPHNYTDVAAGDIEVRHIADLCIYPNRVRALRTSGGALRGWLERAACAFNTIEPGQTLQPLINPTFPSYYCDTIFGLTYEIDLAAPAMFDKAGNLGSDLTGRVRNVMYRGQPLDDQQQFIVVTNDFRASGGGNFPGTDGSTIIARPSATTFDILKSYLGAMEIVDPDPGTTWSFTPIADTSVVFETGPAARRFEHEISNLAEISNPLGANGFIQYELPL